MRSTEKLSFLGFVMLLFFECSRTYKGEPNTNDEAREECPSDYRRESKCLRRRGTRLHKPQRNPDRANGRQRPEDVPGPWRKGIRFDDPRRYKDNADEHNARKEASPNNCI